MDIVLRLDQNIFAGTKQAAVRGGVILSHFHIFFQHSHDATQKQQ